MDNVDYLRTSLIETRRKYELVKKQFKALKKIYKKKNNRKRRKIINLYESTQIIENKNKR